MQGMETAANERKRLSHGQVAVGVMGVFVLQAGYTFVVYRSRVVGHSGLASSDAVLLFLPVLAVFLAYTYFFTHSRILSQAKPMNRQVGLCCLVMLTTFLSLWGSMLLPINLYGE
jgi:hypothetical protein